MEGCAGLTREGVTHTTAFFAFMGPPVGNRIFQKWLQEYLLFPSFSRSVTLPHQDVGSTSSALEYGQVCHILVINRTW